MGGVLQVKFAVYGALQGDGGRACAIDVTGRLQEKITAGAGIVTINNEAMGTDPAIGIKKHFGAIVTWNGHDYPFACEEGQTINFNQALAFGAAQIANQAGHIFG